MQAYETIIDILNEVYVGKNLKLQLAKHKDDKNITKIKNHCYGILRNYFFINKVLDNLANKKITDKNLLALLQIAIFEIKFSTKPKFAVTNDMVNFAKNLFVNNKFDGLVNAIIRNYIRQQNQLEKALQVNLECKYNLPQWILDKIKLQYPLNYQQIFDGFNHHPAFGIRVNHRQISQTDYLIKLTENNIDYGLMEDKIYLSKPIDIKQIPLFKEGIVSVQDVAAQYLPEMLKNVKFKNVLDACAAPGGKTCQILENYDVNLLAIDNDEKRLNSIQDNLARLKLSAKLLLADATDDSWINDQKFDLIIADVPCSATGTFKRNPDIKINRNEYDIENFVVIQRNIVKNLWNMLEKNGHLIYITCSIFYDENQNNIKWFKQNIDDFCMIKELQILPTKFNDSLYYALIRKK